MFIEKMRKLLANSLTSNTETDDHICARAARIEKRKAKRRSKLLDRAIKADWKNEEKRIKLLLLGEFAVCDN